MPVCEGCGVSVDDNFRFCPYCGRANSKPGVTSVSTSREVCYLDQQSGLVDRNNGEYWWEAVCNGKVIAKTQGVRFLYDKKEYKYKRNLFKKADVFFIHPKDQETWGAVNEYCKSQHRALVSKLVEDGWEIISTSEWGDVQMMQRVKRQ